MKNKSIKWEVMSMQPKWINTKLLESNSIDNTKPWRDLLTKKLTKITIKIKNLKTFSIDSRLWVKKICNCSNNASEKI